MENPGEFMKRMLEVSEQEAHRDWKEIQTTMRKRKTLGQLAHITKPEKTELEQMAETLKNLPTPKPQI